MHRVDEKCKKKKLVGKPVAKIPFKKLKRIWRKKLSGC
jgi:hypothetical protein